MSRSTVTAIVVSYNVRDLLLQCIKSLEAARHCGVLDRIIVVDNASSDGSAAAVRSNYPDVTVIDAPNLGYGGGANRGLERCDTTYALVLNPDTIVPGGTISRLAATLDEHQHAGIAGPRMRYPDGSLQSSRRRFPTRLTPVFESTTFERWWPGNPWAHRYRMADRQEDRLQEVDWLVGACLMVRMDAVERVGGFDEAFWMYCEETEWCWRFRRHGWRVVYAPEVEITHHEGASTSQDIARRQLAFDRSRILLQQRLYGRWTAAVCAAGIKAGYAVAVATELAKLLAGHKRDLRLHRIREYLRLLRAGLLPDREARKV